MSTIVILVQRRFYVCHFSEPFVANRASYFKVLNYGVQCLSISEQPVLCFPLKVKWKDTCLTGWMAWLEKKIKKIKIILCHFINFGHFIGFWSICIVLILYILFTICILYAICIFVYFYNSTKAPRGFSLLHHILFLHLFLYAIKFISFQKNKKYWVTYDQ